ncbi:MAG: hypothetical protein DRH50_11555 [Deltaproteobacteria bacterium]|nr:MAG: hypothetical protein DRH50_11555 [Deltaproteobacteria bacterium]
MTDLVLPLDAFVRSVGINKSIPHLFFVGAGASITSGIPSAERCIWEWKRDIFLTKNPGLEEQFAELSLVEVRQRIQRWLDQQGNYPSEASPEEYAFYIEKCFPIPSDRRAYFQEKVREAKLHIGYKLLCHLARIDLIRAVWTTNFDCLTARAAVEGITPVEVGIDCQDRLPRQLRKGELLCVSLHGDYRYDFLKNTSDELQQQESQLRRTLIQQLQDSPCVVIGYSGRDLSIIEAFYEAYAQPGTGALYWCGFGSDDVPKQVIDLIRVARDKRQFAYYVPTNGFDDLLIRLALHCCKGEQHKYAKQTIVNLVDNTKYKRMAFAVEDYDTETVIKSNAFELECPSEVIEFDLKKWPKEQVWSWFRATIRDHPVVAVPFRNKVLALGLIDDLKNVFRENITGRIERTPVTDADFFYEDGAVISLMRQALVRVLAKRADAHTDGKAEIWVDTEPKRISEGNQDYYANESVLIFLRSIGSRQYLLLKPTLRIFDTYGNPAPLEVTKAIKMRLLGTQYNHKFNQAINRWRGRLFAGDQSLVCFEFPHNCASAFRFKVRRAPIFAEIGALTRRHGISIPNATKRLVKHHGYHLPEPQLSFSNKTASGYVKDAHPIRGMINNRPFDFALTQKGLASIVRLGVICPQAEMRLLRDYLCKVMQRHRPLRSDSEYLLEYPGFGNAYGLPLEIAEPDDTSWVTCPEPKTSNPMSGARELASLITQSINNLLAKATPHVLLIFIPNRWREFRGYLTNNECFDLHDFVKAFSVQRGVATQFLEEKTIFHADQCSVWWWLSLALYVKSMRTPWVLDSLDPDTAFVGLGFSIDPAAQRGQHVVLGCSHIYSARGEGLQFRLSKIENPIFRGRNPFMPEKDARRLGETIRQLFYDAKLRLPRRVVIHKRTPFIQQEREGLCEGLSGIDNIEMLEIQIDHALRYVASVWRNGKFDEDNFPVRRGTTVKLDDLTALVWVHGTTSATDQKRRYFQGRRRVPAPIVLRRHMGESDLRTIAQELLGLSKMNWNTFDLYTKIPATIHTSNEIARIGSLLDRFGSASYDYRLFM